MPDVLRVKSSLDPGNDHPYMSGVFRPTLEEVSAAALPVLEGAIPSDIDGIYIRNTEQPTHAPLGGNYHPFDGDAMLHQVSFDGRGGCSYRNRFVRTDGFLAEQEAGRSLWAGVSERAAKSERPGYGPEGYLKDTSSTDVVVHAGKVLTTFYRCGDAYRLDPATLENLGKDRFGGDGAGGRYPTHGMSAHAKVDERTGELLFFNYSATAPFMHYGVVDARGRLAHYVPIPLDAPKLPHDMCFTERHTILCDLATQFDEAQLARGVFKNRTSKKPCRFAVIPRYGRPEQTRFFEVRRTFVLHFLNAYEETDPSTGHEFVVLDGYRQCMYDGIGGGRGSRARTAKAAMQEPAWKKDVPKRYHKIFPALGGMDGLVPRLWRWRFNLTTGRTEDERPLDDVPDRVAEFGMFNQAYAGRPYQYAYSALLAPSWLLFTGLVKHDLRNGTSSSYSFGPGRYCSESPFAPRMRPASEDGGYLVTFVTDMVRDQSECVLLDARNLAAGPVCRLLLPHRISSGTHATWVPRPQLTPGQASKL